MLPTWLNFRFKMLNFDEWGKFSVHCPKSLKAGSEPLPPSCSVQRLHLTICYILLLYFLKTNITQKQRVSLVRIAHKRKQIGVIIIGKII